MQCSKATTPNTTSRTLHCTRSLSCDCTITLHTTELVQAVTRGTWLGRVRVRGQLHSMTTGSRAERREAQDRQRLVKEAGRAGLELKWRDALGHGGAESTEVDGEFTEVLLVRHGCAVDLRTTSPASPSPRCTCVSSMQASRRSLDPQRRVRVERQRDGWIAPDGAVRYHTGRRNGTRRTGCKATGTCRSASWGYFKRRR